MSDDLVKINMDLYQIDPERYELRSGQTEAAPLCPFGNHYEWLGYDLEKSKYVRFTKSVFKLLVNQMNKS